MATAQRRATTLPSPATGDQVAVILFDPDSGEVVSRIKAAPGEYDIVRFSPDGELIAARRFDPDGGIRVTVWEVRSGKELFSIEPEGGAGNFEFLPDGDTLLVPEYVPGAERIGFYSTVDGREIDSLETPGAPVAGIAIDPTGDRLAIGSQATREVQVRDLKSHRLIDDKLLADAAAVEWSPDGQLLAISGQQGSVHLLDAETLDEELVLAGHPSNTYSLDFSADSERLASLGIDAELRIWDVSPDGAPELGAFATSTEAPGLSDVSPDGSQVANFTYAGALELFDAETGETLATRPAVGIPLADHISDDWQRVTWLEPADNPEEGNEASVRDLASGELVSELPQCTPKRHQLRRLPCFRVGRQHVRRSARVPRLRGDHSGAGSRFGTRIAGSWGSARGERRLQPVW